MSPDSGNIRVFVRWDDQSTVYAGDEIRCTICFKNVTTATAGPSNTNAIQSQLKPPPHLSRTANSHPSSRLAPPPSTPTSASRRGHRVSSSLSISPGKTTRGRAGSIPWIPTSHPPDIQDSNGNSHRRSVSIVSIGSVNSADSQVTSNAGSPASRPSSHGHGRSASLQIISRSPVMSGPRSGSWSCLCTFYKLMALTSRSFPPAAAVSRAVFSIVQRVLPPRQSLPLPPALRRLHRSKHP